MGKGLGSIFVRWRANYTNHTQFNHSPSSKNTHKVNLADRVGMIKLVEGSNLEEERESRIVEFELCAKNMGITEEELIAQKVAIWEGMWVAKKSGDKIGVGTPYPGSL